MCSRTEWRKEKQWYEQHTGMTRVKKVVWGQTWVRRLWEREGEGLESGKRLHLCDHRGNTGLRTEWEEVRRKARPLRTNDIEAECRPQTGRDGCGHIVTGHMSPRWAPQRPWTWCRFPSPDTDMLSGPGHLILPVVINGTWLGRICCYLWASPGPVCSSTPCWGLGPAGRGGLSVRDSRGHWLLPGFSQEKALLGNDRMEGERSLGTFPRRQQSRQWLPLLRAAHCPWAGLLWFQLSLDPRPWAPGLSLCLLPGGGGTFPSSVWLFSSSIPRIYWFLTWQLPPTLHFKYSGQFLSFWLEPGWYTPHKLLFTQRQPHIALWGALPLDSLNIGFEKNKLALCVSNQMDQVSKRVLWRARQ